MAATGREREQREARARARNYAARQELHERHVRRRVRDNIAAGVVGGVLLLALAAGQLAFYTVGPGAPAPEVSTPGPSSSPEATTPAPTTTSPAPTPTSTP